jgi:chaperonin GroEL (HSP60 family)
MQEALERGSPWTYDVVRRSWSDDRSIAIADPLSVVTTSLQAAVSAAITVLDAEVLVRGQSRLRPHLWPTDA